MKHIVYTASDGTLCIVVPAPSYAAARAGMTEDEFFAHLIERDVPSDASDVQIIDAVEIPQDRTFRNAWRRSSSGSIEIDIVKAREIHAERMLAAVASESERLAHAERVARAAGRTADADAHLGRRSALDAIDLDALGAQAAMAATLEDLLKVWPASLPRPNSR